MKKVIIALGVLIGAFLGSSGVAFALTNITNVTVTRNISAQNEYPNYTGDRFTADHFVATSTTATSTFANGLNLSGGCVEVGGSCLSSGSGAPLTTTTTIWIDANSTQSTQNGTIQYPYHSIGAAIQSVPATYHISPGTYIEGNLTFTATSTIYADQATILSFSGTPFASPPGSVTFKTGFIGYNFVIATGNVYLTDPALSDPGTLQNSFINGNISLYGLATIQGGQIQGGTLYTGAGSLTNIAGVNINDIIQDAGTMNMDDNNLQPSPAAGAGTYALVSTTTGAQFNISGMSLENVGTNGGGIYCANGATTIPNQISNLIATLGTTTSNGFINCGSSATTLGNYVVYDTMGAELYANLLKLIPNSFAGLNVEGTSTFGGYGIGGDVGIGTTSPSQALSVNGNGFFNGDVNVYSSTTAYEQNNLNTISVSGNNDWVDSAGQFNILGQYNIGIGHQALESISSGDYNIGVGYQALDDISSQSNNIAIGYQTLSSTDGSDMTVVGASAMSDPVSGASDDTAIGFESLGEGGGGPFNTALGSYAGYQSYEPTYDTLIGGKAGYALQSGNYNTALGYSAGYDLSNSSYNIAIGQNVDVPSSASNQQLNIGNLIYGTGLYNGSSPSSAIVNGKVGIGTTTPGTILSLGTSTNFINFNVYGTSTLSQGINIKNGCYAIAGTCLSTSGGGTNYFTNSGATTTLSTGSELDAGSFVATSSSAYNIFAGNVGIGTSSPWTALSVMGNSDLGNNALAGSFTGTTTATSTLAGGLQALALNITSTSASSTFSNGINLSSGCFAINGTCIGAGGGGSGTVNSGLTGQVAFYGASGTSVSGTSTLFLASNGYVGVGSSTPTSPLSVAGPLQISGTGGIILGYNSAQNQPANIYADSSDNLQINAAGGAAKHVTIQGEYTFGNDIAWSIGGNFSPAYSYTRGVSSSAAAGTYTNENLVSNYSENTGLAINDNDLLIARTDTSLGTGSHLFINATDGGISNFSVSNTGQGYFAGNVGIGTTSPWRTLSVNGSSDLGNSALAGFFTGTTTATSTLTGGLAANIFNATSATASSTFSDGINLTGGCFSINNACIGSGGSGSQTPWTSNIAGAGFNLTGVGTASSTNVIGSTNIQAGDGSVGSPGYSFTTATNMGLYDNGNASLELVTGGTGIAKFSTLGITNLISGSGSLPSYSFNQSSSPGLFYAGTQALGISNGSAEIARFNLTGLGIGTTSPYAELSVGTTTTSSAQIPMFIVASSTNQALFTVLNNGSIGIGTSSPPSTLTVQGSMSVYTSSATSTVYLDGSLGGGVIMKDDAGGGCTEIYTLSGVVAGKIVTCPY